MEAARPDRFFQGLGLQNWEAVLKEFKLDYEVMKDMPEAQLRRALNGVKLSIGKCITISNGIRSLQDEGGENHRIFI